jgi:dsDNA-specific endonuclease/ATPase MutS2
VTECLSRGIFELRIIHGKGTRALGRTVPSLLSRDRRVASFHLEGESAGGWGATIVTLHVPAD